MEQKAEMIGVLIVSSMFLGPIIELYTSHFWGVTWSIAHIPLLFLYLALLKRYG